MARVFSRGKDVFRKTPQVAEFHYRGLAGLALSMVESFRSRNSGVHSVRNFLSMGATGRCGNVVFVKFLCVGVLNTLVGLGTIYFGMYFLRLNAAPANAFGYAIGVLFGFVLNKTWTFRNRDGIFYAFFRYILVIGIAYAANLLVVLAAISHLRSNPYLAQAIGIVPYTLLTFVGSRYYAFRSKKVAMSGADKRLVEKGASFPIPD